MKDKSKTGRKPVEDKKKPLRLFIEESVIEDLGKDVIREMCYKLIKKEHKKTGRK